MNGTRFGYDLLKGAIMAKLGFEMKLIDVARYWKGDRCMSYGNYLETKHVRSCGIVAFRVLTSRSQIVRGKYNGLFLSNLNETTF